MIGSGAARPGFAGAPEPNRHLFVFRANPGTSTENVRDHIVSKGVKVIEISNVSHTNAKYRSFKVTIPVSSMDTLLAENMWPPGICVRKYYTTPDHGAQNNNSNT